MSEHELQRWYDLRTELIQVAAVAVAIVTDMDHGSTAYSNVAWQKVLQEITIERLAQEGMWGPQHHDLTVWAAILLEEVGEAIHELVMLPTEIPAEDRIHDHVATAVPVGVECRIWLEERYPPPELKGVNHAEVFAQGEEPIDVA